MQSIDCGLGLGFVPNIDGSIGACGAMNSTFRQLVDLSTVPPALLGAVANVEFEMVTTIGISVTDQPGHCGGGGGTSGGGSGGRGGGIPPGGGGGTHLARPFGVRAIMVAAGLVPVRGMHIVRPAISSVSDFAIRSFESITRYTE